MAVRSVRFQSGLMLATALSVLAMPTAGRPYTAESSRPAPAMRSALQRRNPDVDRVTVCMVRNKSQLSPGCARSSGPIRSSRSRRSMSAGRSVSGRQARKAGQRHVARRKKRSSPTRTDRPLQLPPAAVSRSAGSGSEAVRRRLIRR